MSETAGQCGPNGDDMYCARYWGMSAERDQGADELAKLRDRIEDTALALEKSALATYPSKKSAIEDECATMLRALLETPGTQPGQQETTEGKP